MVLGVLRHRRQPRQGPDDFRGYTDVDTNSGSTTKRFIAADVNGQGGDDDIRYTNNADGGDGEDVIVGTNRADYLKGGENSDLIYGADGDDDIYGQKGWDTLAGQGGDDHIDGGKGNDDCNGGPGNDSKSSCYSTPIAIPGYASWND